MAIMRAWAVKVPGFPIEQTYVSTDDIAWSCFSRTLGGRPIAEIADADIDAAKVAAGPDGHAGIRYGITGVNYQAANRILRAGGAASGQTVTVSDAAGYALSVLLFGEYGLAPTVDAKTLLTTPSMLLQTVITPNPRADVGRLITAVGFPWFDIVELINKDPSAAFQIPPDKWEEIIAQSYVRAGFDHVILTPRSGDFGRDVIATINGIGSVRVIDQVKAYKPSLLVNADDVRALYGVLIADGASKGFLTTTSDFAPRLTTDALLAPLIPSRIELINGSKLRTRLLALARRKL